MHKGFIELYVDNPDGWLGAPLGVFMAPIVAQVPRRETSGFTLSAIRDLRHFVTIKPALENSRSTWACGEGNASTLRASGGSKETS